jgi:hypothetical protein
MSETIITEQQMQVWDGEKFTGELETILVVEEVDHQEVDLESIDAMFEMSDRQTNMIFGRIAMEAVNKGDK